MSAGSLRPRAHAALEVTSMPPSLHPLHRRARSRDGDEENGKRDESFRPRKGARMTSNLGQPWRWRKRRVFMFLMGALLLYIFWLNIPTDLAPIDERMGKAMRPGHVIPGSQGMQEPSGAPPRPSELEEGEEKVERHYYNGPIKFYRLATSLRGISRTMGSRPTNRNVLFAASSLKSVANLMPMACEMGRWDRNYVHLAILGRNPLPLEDILEANGVDRESCSIYFHDARGDYTEFSSDARAGVSVAGAMKHINDFMHPQAIIMDDSSLEDHFFTHSMRKKANEYRRTLIEVPAGRYEDFLWMTRLDSGSLSNWFTPKIDILVHAPPDSSGGIIRLIKSLENADYTGLRAPSITIELPSETEYFVRRYLEEIDWPPEEIASPMKTNALSLRHRIQSSHVNSEQASLRFLESFYPTSSRNHHVLILSPQVDLNPLYLQYLYYLILEYKYSSYGAPEADELLGISLDVPSFFLDGKSGFVHPRIEHMYSPKPPKYEEADQSDPSPFLHQAPSSTASLVFGDKWATFHHFLANRLTLTETGKAEKHHKQVSETEPAWMEYLFELMQARSWKMLHPATPFVSVHNELARIPEEYMRESRKDEKKTEPVKTIGDEPFLTAPEPPVLKPVTENQPNHGLLPLHSILPFEGDLLDLQLLPHMWHTGKLFTRAEMVDFQKTYVSYFRQHMGGCDAKESARQRVVRYTSANDLFCLPGVKPEYMDDEAVEDEAEVAEAIAGSTDPDSNLLDAATNDAKPDDEAKRNDEAKQDDEPKQEVKEPKADKQEDDQKVEESSEA